MARKYSNVSRPMNLVVACNNTDTVITVNDASGLPVTFPYALAVDYEGSTVEIMLVTAAAGNTLTVSRGQEDTAAQAHGTGAVVVHAATALDFAASAIHAEATQNVHGIGAGSSVVGTDTAQTLANKTISGANNTLTNVPSSALTSVPAAIVVSPFTTAQTFNAAATFTSTVKAPDYTIAGTPDRSVKTELDLANKPPRLHLTRLSPNQAIPTGGPLPTNIVFPTVTENIGGWTVNLANGEFSPPRDGFYLMTAWVVWNATFTAGQNIGFYINPAGYSDEQQERLFPPAGGVTGGTNPVFRQAKMLASEKWVAGVYTTGTACSVLQAQFRAIYLSAP